MDNLEVAVSLKVHIETLKKLLFGRSAFIRFSSKEREAINFAINKLEQAVEESENK